MSYLPLVFEVIFLSTLFDIHSQNFFIEQISRKIVGNFLLNIKKLPVLVTKERFMKRLMLSFLTVWMIFFSQHLFAQAADDASDSVYDSGWNNTSNGGTGFGAWVLSTTGAAGHFRDSSTNNGFGDGNSDGDINTSGRAWGMYANSGGLSEAIRPFSTALVAGQKFSISMDNGDVQSGSNQTVGFGLQNSSGENLFEFYFRGGAIYYDFNDLDGQRSSVTYTDEECSINSFN
ncbi:MAG: hypothetical protein R3C26_04595 [Calditrichia bacterium]